MKHVLLALVGMSPAVLTETVWTLVTEKNIIPDEVVVLTTTEGRVKIKKELLDSGIWKKLKGTLTAKKINIKGRLLFGKSEGVSRSMSAARKRLAVYLPSHLLMALLPLRDDPVTYPVNRIKFKGKNPFVDIRG